MAESNYLEVEPQATSLLNMVDPEPMETDIPSPMPQDIINAVKPSAKPIKPSGGFCVKAQTSNNEKLFINVCHSPDIPRPPASINVHKLISGETTDKDALCRFPLSLGELHLEKDKKDIECQCYDVVLNSDYYDEVMEDAILRDFIMTLACSGLERKYKISINIETCKFLNKPYHGTMPPHFIRLKPARKPKLPPAKKTTPNRSIVVPTARSSRLRILPQPQMCGLKLFDVPCIRNLPLLIFQGCTNHIDGKALCISITERSLTVRMRHHTNKVLATTVLPRPVFPKKSLANYWKNRLTVAMFVKPEPRP